MGFTKKPLKYMLLSLGLLVLFLCATDPARLPSVLLIVPFVLLFIALTATISLLLGFKYRAIAPRQVRMAAFGASLPLLLLVLQSVGQLTVRDMLTIMALFGLAYFYVTKLRAQAQS